MHQALYRVHRPRNFSDIVGQDTIVQILQNQIAGGTISHAYLFSGSRGTGKTSMAKVFSKAINCRSPIDQEPCHECLSCREGEVDIIEIDAASNNSVDNIRDIRDNVIYTPTYGKYKVYIIDEVHMLSQGAFNALLKTLEEPPSHVVFILATTEPQKIPATVLSRVQRHDFKKIDAIGAENRLKSILKTMELHYEEAALRLIIQKSQGSLRDGLSMLDKAISLGELTYEKVQSAIGDTDGQMFGELITLTKDKNLPKLFHLLENLYEEGKDMKMLVVGLIDYLRDLILLQAQARELISKEGQDLASLEQVATKIEPEEALWWLEELSELEGAMKYSPHPRVVLESFFVKKVHLPAKQSSPKQESTVLPSGTEQIFKLEQKIKLLEEQLHAIEQRGGGTARPAKQTAIEKTVKERKNKANLPYFDDISIQEKISDEERGILEEISAKMEEVYATLQKSKQANIKALLQSGEPVRYVADHLYIGYDEGNLMLKNMIDNEENKGILENVFAKILHKEIGISFILKREMGSIQEAQPKEEEIIENIKKAFPDVPVEVYENQEEYEKAKMKENRTEVDCSEMER